MKSKFVKGLSVLLIVLFGLYFTACGKVSDKNKADETSSAGYEASTREKTSEYRSFFEEINIDLKDSYISASTLSNDYYYAVITKTTDEEELGETRLHRINLATKEDTVSEPIIDMSKGFGYFQNVHVNDDGSVILLKCVYGETGSRYFSINMTPEGEVGEEKELSSGIFSDGYISRVEYADEKVFYVLDEKIVVCDMDGKKVGEIKTGSWVNSTFKDKEGNFYISYYSEKGMGFVQKKVNTETLKLENIKEEIPLNGTLLFGKDGNKYSVSDEGFYRFNNETNTYELLFMWVNVDLSMVQPEGIKINDDGTIIFVKEDYSDKGTSVELVTIKEVKLTAENKRESIVCGCMFLDWDSREQVIRFNKKNDKYHIELKVYSEEIEDYEAARDRMKMDIAAGNVLDMVWLDGYTYKEYVNADAFEDLKPYFDASYDRKDFFTNVLDSFETDGKMYGITDRFSLSMIVGRKSLIGAGDSLSMEEFMELRKKNMNSDFMAFMTKETMLFQLLSASTDSFIDYENVSCNFASDEFISYLNFANTFPDDFPSKYESDWESLKEGRVLFSPVNLSGFMDAESYNEILDGDMKYIGFPSTKGSSISVTATNMMSILKTSKNKDISWEYIKSILDDDTINGTYGFPIRRSVYDDNIKREMEIVTYTDENGVEQKEARGGMSVDGFMVEYYGLSQETADMVTKAIESATMSSMDMDDEIYIIIGEEAEAFFKGHKSAEEVANIIQSRVSIYLAEQY